MATIYPAISSIRVTKHDMTRSYASNLCGEHLALFTILDKKGNEASLEAIDYILKVLLLFHN